MIGTNNNIIICESISEDYEWIQYNNQLRIIHSIKDDMYQMKSIVDALHPSLIKEPRRWIELDSTAELIAGFEEMTQKTTDGNIAFNKKLVENRQFLAPKIKGWYCNKLLVNLFAAWVNPRYAYYIALILDSTFQKEREQMENKIQEQKPRMVPQMKEKNYKYMIWKEEQSDDPDMILLHLVRRNKRVFSQVQNIANNPDKCWFYRDNLPIVMTPNEDVKTIVKKLLPGSEYDIKGCSILTYKEHLPKLHDEITKYFNEFQK